MTVIKSIQARVCGSVRTADVIETLPGRFSWLWRSARSEDFPSADLAEADFRRFCEHEDAVRSVRMAEEQGWTDHARRCKSQLRVKAVKNEFVNFTPHPITLRLPTGEDVIIPPSGKVARVATTEAVVGDLDGIPVVTRELGAVEIPEWDRRSLAMVSSMVLDAAKAQNHAALGMLVAPDTGPTAIREGGQVKAVTRLVSACWED